MRTGIAVAALAIALASCTAKVEPIETPGSAAKLPTAPVTVESEPSPAADEPLPAIDESQVDPPASYGDAWSISGIGEAYSELDQHLQALCKDAADQSDCIAAHMVQAYDAKEGAAPCRSKLIEGTFADCIVNGKLLSEVVKRAGITGITPQEIWYDRDEAWRKMSKEMTTAAHDSCANNDQSLRDACIANYPLRFFGLDQPAISACPAQPAWDDCVVGTALVRLIRGNFSKLR